MVQTLDMAEQPVVSEPEQPDGGEAVREPPDLGDGVAEQLPGLDMGKVRYPQVDDQQGDGDGEKTASLKNRILSYPISPALATTRQRWEAAAMSGSVPAHSSWPEPQSKVGPAMPRRDEPLRAPGKGKTGTLARHSARVFPQFFFLKKYTTVKYSNGAASRHICRSPPQPFTTATWPSMRPCFPSASRWSEIEQLAQSDSLGDSATNLVDTHGGHAATVRATRLTNWNRRPRFVRMAWKRSGVRVP